MYSNKTIASLFLKVHQSGRHNQIFSYIILTFFPPHFSHPHKTSPKCLTWYWCYNKPRSGDRVLSEFAVQSLASFIWGLPAQPLLSQSRGHTFMVLHQGLDSKKSKWHSLKLVQEISSARVFITPKTVMFCLSLLWLSIPSVPENSCLPVSKKEKEKEKQKKEK